MMTHSNLSPGPVVIHGRRACPVLQRLANNPQFKEALLGVGNIADTHSVINAGNSGGGANAQGAAAPPGDCMPGPLPQAPKPPRTFAYRRALQPLGPAQLAQRAVDPFAVYQPAAVQSPGASLYTIHEQAPPKPPRTFASRQAITVPIGGLSPGAAAAAPTCASIDIPRNQSQPVTIDDDKCGTAESSKIAKQLSEPVNIYGYRTAELYDHALIALYKDDTKFREFALKHFLATTEEDFDAGDLLDNFSEPLGEHYNKRQRFGGHIEISLKLVLLEIYSNRKIFTLCWAYPKILNIALAFDLLTGIKDFYEQVQKKYRFKTEQLIIYYASSAVRDGIDCLTVARVFRIANRGLLHLLNHDSFQYRLIYGRASESHDYRHPKLKGAVALDNIDFIGALHASTPKFLTTCISYPTEKPNIKKDYFIPLDARITHWPTAEDMRTALAMLESCAESDKTKVLERLDTLPDSAIGWLVLKHWDMSELLYTDIVGRKRTMFMPDLQTMKYFINKKERYF